MNVAESMTSQVATCTAAQTLANAARIMWERDVGCVPVVDFARRPIAVITDRDICVASYTRGRPLHTIDVASAMSRSIVTCTPDTTIRQAEHLLRRRRRHLLSPRSGGPRPRAHARRSADPGRGPRDPRGILGMWRGPSMGARPCSRSEASAPTSGRSECSGRRTGCVRRNRRNPETR